MLLFVPVLVAVVTELLNTFDLRLSILLFPPLASGTYTLFANRRGSTPIR